MSFPENLNVIVKWGYKDLSKYILDNKVYDIDFLFDDFADKVKRICKGRGIEIFSTSFSVNGEVVEVGYAVDGGMPIETQKLLAAQITGMMIIEMHEMYCIGYEFEE